MVFNNMNFVRKDNRKFDEMRKVVIQRNWSKNAEGSALISIGDTKVLCTASFTQGVPQWLKGSRQGWLTAEYSMLPRSTSTRNSRESVKGKLTGRTQEISRLIGRSLRSIIDLKKIGENTIIIDCDVLQADGGTRTASVTGAYVALEEAIKHVINTKQIKAYSVEQVLKNSISAISVGIYNGIACLDLSYIEDSIAQTDMNVVMTSTGEIVEIQGTAEKVPFNRQELNDLLDLAQLGNKKLCEIQQSKGE